MSYTLKKGTKILPLGFYFCKHYLRYEHSVKQGFSHIYFKCMLNLSTDVFEGYTM